MSDQVQELLDVPRNFMKEGMQFINRCQKPPGFPTFELCAPLEMTMKANDMCSADMREYTKLCQAVGVGFLVMGFIGYIVKLG